MSEFKIYTASAGSGKTFQLTRHYLELLLREPDNYKKILAVTFTNKAAGELKERVVKELVEMSGDNPAKSHHFRHLAIILNKEDSVLQQRAKKILRNILQDYGHFSIGTIDHFFQKVLRSFSRELGIHNAYNLELNSNVFLDGSIALMMNDLDTEPALLNWLGKWVDYKISNDESWNNIEKDLKSIGFEFLKEQLLEEMTDEGPENYSEEAISAFSRHINGIEKSFNDELQSIREETNSILNRFGLEAADFKGGSRSPVAFLLVISPDNLSRSRHTKAIDNEEEWYKKTLPVDIRLRVIEAWSEGLNALLKKVNEYLDQNEAIFLSATSIRQFLFSLGLSGKLMAYINKYSEKSNSLLINLTSPFLSRIIGENPSPFIYEKVGTYYDHFMIDEFQDTSNLQWANFLPLIRNSLSDNDFSMVVGDVKQSIFRWRNSNWKLMALTAANDLSVFGVEKLRLGSNWRSRDSIIDFNNLFFERAPRVLVDKINEDIDSYSGKDHLIPEVLKNVYSDSGQEKGSSKPGGYVEIGFQDEEEENESWDLKIPHLVEDLQINHNYKPEDITFLVRKNKQVKSIIKILQAYKDENPVNDKCSFNLVSSESYELQNSASLRCIIWAIRYILEPNETYFKARLAQEYISLKKKQPSESDLKNISLLSSQPELFNVLLPEELAQNRLLYRYSSVSRVIEEIIRVLDLQTDKREMPYIMAFRDQAIGGAGKNDKLEDICAWWDDQGKEVTVPMSEQTGSMRAMTIHKAKGLEFKVVIMPYCDWEMGGGNSRQLMWVDTSGTPFSQVPLVPLKFGSALAKTTFSSVYYEEKIQIYMDNLNLIYVAFTRAKDRLHAFCPRKLKKGGYTVGDLLGEVLNPEMEAPDTFSFGLAHTIPVQEKASADLKIVEILPYQPEPYTGISGLRQVYDSEPIHYGKVMHEILEKTEQLSDLEPAVNQMVENGEIAGDNAGQILSHLTSLLGREDIADWFNGSYKIYREESILVPGKGEMRPDRLMEREGELIVLDYKFGEQRDSHRRQVSEYKNAFEKMGYNRVTAFLLYPETGMLKEIN